MELINREKKRGGWFWTEIFIAKVHCCLLEAAAKGALINNTMKPKYAECTFRSISGKMHLM